MGYWGLETTAAGLVTVRGSCEPHTGRLPQRSEQAWPLLSSLRLSDSFEDLMVIWKISFHATGGAKDVVSHLFK